MIFEYLIQGASTPGESGRVEQVIDVADLLDSVGNSPQPQDVKGVGFSFTMGRVGPIEPRLGVNLGSLRLSLNLLTSGPRIDGLGTYLFPTDLGETIQQALAPLNLPAAGVGGQPQTIGALLLALESLGSFVVEWEQPREPVYLRKILLTDTAGEIVDADIVSLYVAAVIQVERRSSTPRDSRLFLDIDLASSFDRIAGREQDVVDAIGLGDEAMRILESLNASEVESLRAHLGERVLARAVCSAGELNPESSLAGLGLMQFTADRVAKLLLLVIRNRFGACSSLKHVINDVWLAFLRFATGEFALGGGRDRLNIEPNSDMIACFAELFDIAGNVRETSLSAEDVADCQRMRIVCSTMLEPFFEVYASSRRRPRRVGLYVMQNRRAHGWTLDRMKSLIRDHGSIMSRPWEADWVLSNWGRNLRSAYRDEFAVQRICNGPFPPA